MRIQEVEAFLAVCKYGSFTRAAEKTFTTQPTISQQIASLEREFNTELITRGKGQHRVALTPAGRAFYTQAEKWAQIWRETTSILDAAKTETYSIASVISFADYAFPAISRHFRELQLPCSLTLAGATSTTIYTQVENGVYDCGLVCLMRQVDHLSVTPLASEKLLFVCKKDSRYGDFVNISDLRVSEQIRIMWTVEGRAWFERWFGTAGKPFIDITAIRNPSVYFAIPDAWSLIPASYLPFFDSNVFRTCQMDNPPPNRIFSLISRYPIKEPFYTATYDALVGQFRKIPDIKLLVD